MARTLLIIENDESLVDIVQFEFAEHGWNILTASDGNRGIELALEHRPTAIICDIIMGEVHGFDVLRALREHREMKNTVIVMTSAKAYKPDIDRARDLGATDYVVKPFRTDELRALVERRLEAPRELEP